MDVKSKLLIYDLSDPVEYLYISVNKSYSGSLWWPKLFFPIGLKQFTRGAVFWDIEISEHRMCEFGRLHQLLQSGSGSVREYQDPDEIETYD